MCNARPRKVSTRRRLKFQEDIESTAKMETTTTRRLGKVTCNRGDAGLLAAAADAVGFIRGFRFAFGDTSRAGPPATCSDSAE